MPPRSEVYQSRLDGYVLLRAKPRLAQLPSIPYLPFEGEAWWPIDVDSGSKDSPIDVEWWTYLRDNPGNWGDSGANGTSSGTVPVPAKVVAHQLCSGPESVRLRDLLGYAEQARQSAVYARILLQVPRQMAALETDDLSQAPIRDNAFEMELADAIGDGRVAAPTEQGTAPAYDWEGRTFPST
ncbi:hypothetical protein B0H17DRAFT_1136407 [Mycena rosella]|uniref:Uncharacterized protein n=1 Tax=Mycena rosella TaxID=1033263 RepID=A0AAD7DAW2_MYCRO|nr:hypothetical protein B0H17DRAFT_1136407 [Mycena rosella]